VSQHEYSNIHSPGNLKIVPCIHTGTIHNRISTDYPDEVDRYLTPGKKRRLRVVENGVLRETVGSKRDKEAGD